jgi:hypothetical protein
MVGVRDRDPPDSRVGEHGQTALQIEAAGRQRIEHQRPDGVGLQRAGLGEPGGLELMGVVDISGEDEIEGRAVTNLREEVARRAENPRSGLTDFETDRRDHPDSLVDRRLATGEVACELLGAF